MSKWIEQIDEITSDSLLITKLASGVDLVVFKKRGFTKKFGFFGTKYGSFNQCFEWEGKQVCMPSGIAHFLEHKIFEVEEGNLFDKFAAFGAHVNAYTSYNSTVYHFSTNDHFDDCLKTLMHFVQRINLTDENVEKEKGIIIQELKSYEDEAEYQAYFRMVGEIYETHPLRQDVGGSQEDVLAITREELETCYNAFYSPENMAVIVAGDVDEEEVFELVNQSLTEEFKKRKTAVKTPIVSDSLTHHSTFKEFEAEIQMPYFTLGLKGPNNFTTQEDCQKQVAAVKILFDTQFGRGSKLYNDLYDQNLINTSFGLDVSYGENYSFVNFEGESNHPDLVVEAIRAEVKKCVIGDVDRDGFERVKKKMIGRIISAGNSVQYTASTIVSNFMKEMPLFDYSRAFMGAEIEDAIDYLKIVDTLNCSAVVVAKPFERE